MWSQQKPRRREGVVRNTLVLDHAHHISNSSADTSRVPFHSPRTTTTVKGVLNDHPSRLGDQDTRQQAFPSLHPQSDPSSPLLPTKPRPEASPAHHPTPRGMSSVSVAPSSTDPSW